MKTTSAHARLRQLQHRIYRALQREAESIFGEPPASIVRYEREWDRDFRGSFRVSTKEELVAAIRRHDVTFIADYHPFAQSQRTALRLMRESVLAGEKWALGVELIPSQYQRVLDDFQAGKISVETFHHRIRYQEEWGFPWKNYEPLFAWARTHGVRLVALNRPRELVYRDFPAGRPDLSVRDLHARDQWAAGIITDLFQATPGLRMLVLYGGHHVGRDHLPKQLDKVSRAFLDRPLSSLSVHQNKDNLYWKLARQERELHAQILKLRRDTYCVFSATPWAQLQSLISSAEGEDLEENEEPGHFDYLSMMGAYGDAIAEFLGLERASFESLSIRTIDEADFVDSLTGTFSPGELRLIGSMVASNERIYLPRVQVAYLASPSQNSAAEFAAIHLLRQTTRHRAFFEGGREDFFRMVLESAFGFLGSLVLNPRRKCDLPADHARRLRLLGRGSEREAFSGERRARQLALSVLSPGLRKRELALSELPARASAQAAWVMVGARHVGQILAKSIHPTLLAHEHGAPEFSRVVSLFVRRRGFEEAFWELHELAFSKSPRTGRRVATSKSETI